MPPPSPPMQRAIDAARQVRGHTSPNPWVGAVVVRDGHVISVGATAPPGGKHAEAAALSGVDARGATLYVVLEPCAPFPGKRTRPCVETIIEAGVSRVVVAIEDPDANIRGRGIALLRKAGIPVAVGDGADAVRELLRPYIKHRVTGLPYVIARFAATLDGRVAAASGDSRWITGAHARARVHQERAWVDAVVAGSGTVIADDPALTARPGGVAAARQPIRVLLDSRGRIAPGARALTGPGHVVVATSSSSSAAWRRQIAAAGAQLIECEPAPGGIDLDQLLQVLGRRSILSAWVEGGPSVLGAFLESGLTDELWAFIAPAILGEGAVPAVRGATALTMADALRLHHVVIEPLHPDVLVRGYTGSWEPPA